MFSSSQFDANNAFSGGGFTPSQSSQPADYQFSSSARVTLVVFDKEERASDVNFIVDDGTGRMQCKRWASGVFDTKEMEAIQDGIYVHLIGLLKNFQGKKQAVAFSVRPVKNFDEITYHYIDCIAFHLQNSNLQVQGVSTTQPQIVDSSLNTPARTESNGYHTAPSNQPVLQFSIDGLKDCDQLIMDYLQQPSSSERERGVHISELSQQLKIPEKKIMDSIASLENEGLVYSTIDEFHYKFARG